MVRNDPRTAKKQGEGKGSPVTYKAFQEYTAKVLARLVKVCVQHQMPVDQADGVMRLARDKGRLIWTSFEAMEDVQDVAEALWNLKGETNA